MNLIEVNIIDEEGMLDANEFKFEVPEIVRRAKEYVGKDLIIGIRPEDIYIDSDGIEFHVEAVEP